jgi:hypothetical protein
MSYIGQDLQPSTYNIHDDDDDDDELLLYYCVGSRIEPLFGGILATK